MSSPFETELLKVLSGIAAIESATVWWETVYRDGHGGGADRATASSREILQIGIAARLRRIDARKWPTLSTAPYLLPNGRWQAQISWHETKEH